MRLLFRSIAFGIVCGFIWAIVPLTLSDLGESSGQTASVLLSGSLSGIAVAFLLVKPLEMVNLKGSVAIGVVSLPLGGFLFGIIVSWVHLGLSIWPGVNYHFVRNQFAPLESGKSFAMGSLTLSFNFILIPLAVATTLLLQNYLHSQNQRPD